MAAYTYKDLQLLCFRWENPLFTHKQIFKNRHFWERELQKSNVKQTLTDSNIPTFNSFPKTVLSPSAEQFQRPFLNWNWHSLMPIWAPSPMTIMASGRLWQIIRCLGAKPGILLQIMLAPRATTDEKPLWMENEYDWGKVAIKLVFLSSILYPRSSGS